MPNPINKPINAAFVRRSAFYTPVQTPTMKARRTNGSINTAATGAAVAKPVSSKPATITQGQNKNSSLRVASFTPLRMPAPANAAGHFVQVLRTQFRFFEASLAKASAELPIDDKQAVIDVTTQIRTMLDELVRLTALKPSQGAQNSGAAPVSSAAAPTADSDLDIVSEIEAHPFDVADQTDQAQLTDECGDLLGNQLAAYQLVVEAVEQAVIEDEHADRATLTA
jgi:hypothetical protein